MPAGVKLVPHRAGRLPRGLLLPLAILVVAAGTLALRAARPDWRGLSQEARAGLGALFQARKTEGAKPVAAEGKPWAAPVAIAKLDPPKPAVATPEKAPAAWDEIRREAEGKKAELAETEKLRDEAEAKFQEEVARMPPPNPAQQRGVVIRGLVVDRARMAQLQRQQTVMMQQFMAGADRGFARFVEEQRRDQERFMRQMQRQRSNGPAARQRPAAPIRPRPGMPAVQEESGEEVVNGVLTQWRSRVIVIRSDQFAGF